MPLIQTVTVACCVVVLMDSYAPTAGQGVGGVQENGRLLGTARPCHTPRDSDRVDARKAYHKTGL